MSDESTLKGYGELLPPEDTKKEAEHRANYAAPDMPRPWVRGEYVYSTMSFSYKLGPVPYAFRPESFDGVLLLFKAKSFKEAEYLASKLEDMAVKIRKYLYEMKRDGSSFNPHYPISSTLPSISGREEFKDGKETQTQSTED